jgi:hypothetical protein
MNKAIPDFHERITTQLLKSIESTKDLPPSFIRTNPIPNFARLVNLSTHESKQAEALDRINGAEAKAYFLSCGAEGANAILAYSNTNSLSDPEFIALIRSRLGLPAHDNTPPPGPCPYCNNYQDGTGIHATHCQKDCAEPIKSKNTLGNESSRHAFVKSTLHRVLGQLAKDAGTAGVIDGSLDAKAVEPKYENHATLKHPERPLTVNDPKKGDVIVHYAPTDGRPPMDYIIDLVISSALPTNSLNEHSATSTRNVSSALAYNRKIDKVEKVWTINPGTTLTPVSIETGGSMDPRTRSHLATFVRKAILLVPDASPNDPSPSTADPLTFNSYFTQLLNALSVATAKKVAQSLLWYSTTRANAEPSLRPPPSSPRPSANAMHLDSPSPSPAPLPVNTTGTS